LFRWKLVRREEVSHVLDILAGDLLVFPTLTEANNYRKFMKGNVGRIVCKLSGEKIGKRSGEGPNLFCFVFFCLKKKKKY
jgi:hypothetical protein